MKAKTIMKGKSGKLIIGADDDSDELTSQNLSAVVSGSNKNRIEKL